MHIQDIMSTTQAYTAVLQDLAWPIMGTAIATLFISLLFHYSRRDSGPDQAVPQEGELPKTRRVISLRVRGISGSYGFKEIQDQLAGITNDDGMREHPPVWYNAERRCAVVDINTSLAEFKLLQRLNSNPKQLHIYDCNFFGLTPLNEFEDAKVDVIAVPGLASHAVGSWKSGTKFWLRDFLPRDLAIARILLYGYDTKLLQNEGKSSIRDLGQQFLETVTAFRSDVPRRPVVLIGHSLGGLLIKEALVHAHKTSNISSGSRHNLHKACCGLLFFGVPNHGLRNENLPSLVHGQPNQKMIEDLVVDKDSEPSPFLQRLSDDFARCCKRPYRVVSFFERRHSPTVEMSNGTLRKTGPGVLLVTEKSATSTGLTAVPEEDNIPLDTDHSGLVKYEHEYGPYEIVKTILWDMVSDAKFEDELSSKKKRQWDNLNVPPYNFFRDSTDLSKPATGTLLWLVQGDNSAFYSDESALHSSHFLSWRDSGKSDRLLVTAGPGKGKSVLSNFVLNHLESADLHNSKVIYYFCNIKNNADSHNAKSIMRALVVQMCEDDQGLFDKIPSDLIDNSQQFFSASLETLLEIFRNLLQHTAYKQVFCVIDGLDVYSDGREAIIEALRKVCDRQMCDTAFKLLCTSRPYSEISEAWGGTNKKALRCDSKDIAAFISSQKQSLSVATAKLIDDRMTDQLCERAQDTFLWITLVFRELAKIKFPSKVGVRRVIENSSTGLYQLYAELVERATREDKDYARLLVMVVFARRPLRLCEIEDAISMRHENMDASYKARSGFRQQVTSETLRQGLGTLLDIVGDTVYLIHQSLKDFVLEKEPFRDIEGLSPRLLPAFVSMRYLNLCHEASPSDLCTKIPYIRYAAQYWYRHIESTQDIHDNSVLKDVLKRVVMPEYGRLKSWTTIHRHNRPREHTSFSTVGQVALVFDIGWLAEGMLEQNMHLPCDFEEDCVAQAAKRTGFVDVLEVLLTHEAARAYAVPAEAVSSIVKYQESDVMQLLLRERQDEVDITQNLLLPAVQSDEGEGMLRLLLEKCGDKVVVTPRLFLTATVNWAGEEMFRLLLGISGAEDQITPSVLVNAAESVAGKGIMRVLLQEYGLKIEVTSRLLIAAIEGESDEKPEIVRLLLEECEGEVEITPSMLIKAAGSVAGKGIMKVLLQEYGLEIEVTSRLLIAAIEGESDEKPEIMRLLLEECEGEVEITPEVLIAALEGEVGHREGIVRLLLEEYGDGVEITENVVIAAIRSGEEMVQLLCEARQAEVARIYDTVAAARRIGCGKTSSRT